MSLVVAITGSPGATSRSLELARHVGAQLGGRGFEVEVMAVRDLDPTDLLHGRVDAPSIRAALDLIARAAGVVVSTPVYKASYTGLIKAFLDLLPQRGLAGKVVLPLAVGGTLAHVLAIDYALRPVLVSLGALHVVNGLFVLDDAIARDQGGGIALDPETELRLEGVVAQFAASIELHRADAAAA